LKIFREQEKLCEIKPYLRKIGDIMHVYEQEKEKLNKLFENVEDDKKQLVQGLIEDAAFLYAENANLRDKMSKCGGMIKFHPDDPSLQKDTKAAGQYLRNVNSYATVIKALNSVLQKNVVEDEDAFMKWLKEKMGFATGEDKKTN
jgi:regulator of replication initiation timing